MTDPVLEFLSRLIRVGPADYLLIGLVSAFVVSGVIYRLRIEAECRKIMGSLGKVKRSVEEAAAEEKKAREELQNQLNVQNQNMTRINYWKKRKGELSRMPVSLDRELEELVAWCHKKQISVDVRKRQAARRVPPRGQRL